MEYDIYYHDDFDGMASAAVMLDFLESRGGKIKKFIPIKYDIRPKWPKIKFPRPTVIVDFYYHPEAAFWFDHHPTSFIKSEWKKKFRPDKFHHFDSKYSSCCHLVLDRLVKHFQFRPPPYFRELVRWADTIDGAKYRSALQTIEAREPALRIREFIEEKKHGAAENARLITLFSEKSPYAIVREPRIKRAIAALQKKKAEALKFYRAHLRRYGRLAFIRLPRNITFDVRFAPYYFHPLLFYALRFMRLPNGVYHIGLGANPWQRKKNGINIGAFLRKHYKGGGHKDVGGAEFRSRKAAEKAIQEIIHLLGKKTAR